MMKTEVGKVLLVILGVILVLGIVIGAVGYSLPRRSFPKIDGEIRLQGLDGGVDIFRDAYGIPHIYASSSHDLFFAQGYVHAQDRFWQMDYWRHLGSARLSEMFGEGQLGVDKFLRTLGWARVVKDELAALDETTQASLQAYAEGVNAYLADHKGSALSLEYVVLGLLTPDYEPEPWEQLHSLIWAKVMAWDLGSGKLNTEIQRTVLLNTLTPEQVNEIVPPYPEEHPVIVPDYAGNAGVAPKVTEENLNAYSPAFEQIANSLDLLTDALGPSGDWIGSNNWVISGERTATGMPILANDMHLGVQMPSIWYEVGLYCKPVSVDCPYEVTGYSFAGVPSVVVGHNSHIAWGFTNVSPDVIDLYIEKVNPNNPDQYEVNGQWVDMELVEEMIEVAGDEPVEITVRYTRHGPIISDVYSPLEDFEAEAGIDLPANYAIAIRWTALEPTRIVNAILGINRAQNWDDFRKATRDFAVPAQNLVYADVEGNIGYQTPGNIPIRKSGHDGRTPVPGWVDDYEWQGYIPFEELPFTFNPPQGYVATANNAVVGEEYPYSLAMEWDYGHRAKRVVNLIENAPDPITVDYVKMMQGDNKDLNAEQLVPYLMQLPLNEARLQEARSLLEGWDYQDNMDQAAPALFNVFWRHLLALTFNDDLPEPYQPEGGSRWFVVVGNLVGEPQSPWWDDQTTVQVETRDDIFTEALRKAVDELEGSQGGDPDRWNWGELHTVVFRNPTLGISGVPPIEALFNRGPYRTSGSSSVVNNTAWDASETNPDRLYQLEGLPSERMIVDLFELKNSLSIHPTGQSGHVYQAHYTDMIDMWRNIQYHPMLWERSEIELLAEGHLQLVP